VIAKFDAFFKKRMETEKLLQGLEQRKAELGHELDGLKQKAIAFNLASGKTDVKKHVAELDRSYKEYERKKGLFAQELERLRAFIGRDDASEPLAERAKEKPVAAK